jgi:SAM-dependent methyltransferase
MSTTPEVAQIKATMKAVWTAGDFGQIAAFSVKAAEDFVARTAIKPGARVLDVACGTGNTAIPAARAGADVIGVDIAPNLLAQARQRAAAEDLPARFQEGDAEELAFPDTHFDTVISMFGAMFAPRPDRVATELLRVSRPGAMVAMANWTPDGFVGKSFQVTSKMSPSPPGLPSPLLWGDESVVRQRFSHAAASVTCTRHNLHFEYPVGPKEVVAHFRQYFGPTKTTFARLDERGQAELAAQLEALWSEYNQARDGSTRVDAEYLDVRVVRA